MKMQLSTRVASLPEYAFKQIDDSVTALRANGISTIDFGVGDPSTPTPKAVRETCKAAIDTRASSGYPSYIGSREYLEAVAAWTKRRFGVQLDPGAQVTSTQGSKEAVFNFHEAFVNPGDIVLVPSPGYPPYSRGTRFAEGKPYFYPLDKENGFLPDLSAIPNDVADNAKIMWVNYPNSPTGVCPDIKFFEKLYRWTRDHEIVLASDEAYSEFYYKSEPPPSALQVGTEGIIVFNSLSKRSAMTCYRIGWAAGDPFIVSALRKVKTNIDSGTPTFIQDAAVAALNDEDHVALMRGEYKQKRDILCSALAACGLEHCLPDGTIYVWQKTPKAMSSIEFATRLAAPDIAIVCIPGTLISDTLSNGRNPGEGYVRFALTPTLEETRNASQRLRNLKI